MNVHVTEPAAPLTLHDLEDLVCRLRVMASIAWEHQSNLGNMPHPDAALKVDHLVRATSELATELYADFYAALEGRVAA